MLDHPDIYTEDQYALLQKSLQPVYGLTEGLTQNFFMKTMHSILDSGLLLPDPLPADISQTISAFRIQLCLETDTFSRK